MPPPRAPLVPAMPTRTATFLFVLSLSATIAFAQQDWRPCFPTIEPGARVGARMAFDAARSELVLFGGQAAPAQPSADTWVWNGTTWTQRTPVNAPSGRTLHEMCYDSTRQRVVLYGGMGAGGLVYGDTWEWDGTNWTQATPLAIPPVRASGALAYSGTRTFLFGGGNSAAPRNDTWLYNGVSWSQVPTANAPSPRYYHSMASNGAGELLVFGGFDPTGAGYSNETWRFTGSNWTQVTSPNSPLARGSANLVWDGTRYLLWGGSDSFFQALEDTWAFSGGQWTQLTTVRSPSSRARAAGAWFAPNNRLMLYGGSTLQVVNLRNDVMWEFGTNLASFVRWGTTVCPTLDPPWIKGASQPALGSTFQARVESYSWVAAFMLMGFSTTTWAGGSLPYDLQTYTGWPNCFLRVSPDVTLYLGFAQSSTWSLTIPNDPGLAGVAFHLQGFTYGQGGSPHNLAIANAGTAVIEAF